jgi:uncharacterized repeat protein (TIGR03803 family)
MKLFVAFFLATIALFGVSAQGQTYQVLHEFLLPPANPDAALIQASDGNFYGTTYNGGATNNGTVFKMDSSGAVTTLHSFAGPDGAHPEAGLIQGSDGNFYGTTVGVVFGGGGTVFKMDSSGAVTTLHSFAAQPLDGANPVAALIQGSDGNLYGTTARGGANDKGTVFKMHSSGAVTSTLTTLHSFGGQPLEGSLLYAGLIQGSDGNFYGTTLNGGAADKGTVFKMDSSGAVTTLHSFAGQGANPYAGLTQGSDGNFYGTTQYGGATNKGSVFKMDPSGVVTPLHSFAGSDGASPTAGLIQGSDGNFYGTTFQGGANSLGTVFRMDASGTVTTLHSFAGTGPIPPIDFDGANPLAGLIQASDGNFYGMTNQGGANNLGTVFKMYSSGAVTTLYSFAGQPSDGATPYGELIQASDGNFYGTTNQGGANNLGTVFKMDSSGAVTTLHSFAGGDGASPTAGLIQVSGGNFYGTTYLGGATSNGTVFKMDSSGAVTTLHSFGGSDGANPHAGLILGSDGNFYGTTAYGGTVFKMDSLGTVTTLHSFAGGNGTWWPFAGLIQGSDGNFYGTTALGGASDAGTVFRINFPPVQLLRAVSRKTHGTAGAFDINLPLTGNPGIECRSGGANGDYTLVFTFANTLTNVSGASVTGGTGSVASDNMDTSDAHNYIVNLTGVINAQVITISLANVTDSAGNFSSAISVSMGVLLGDVDATGRTDSGDVTQVRNRTVSIPDQQTFRFDVNTSGRIDAGDVTATRNASVTVLP